MNFDFVKNEDLSNYCLRIASEMVVAFDIGEDEAFTRVAHFIRRRNPDYAYLILHRSVRYWAEGIYYRWDEAGEMTGEPKPLGDLDTSSLRD